MKRIKFGNYPQSCVKDCECLNEYLAKKMIGKRVDELFTAFPYYINGKKESFMYYYDFEYENLYYRCVYLFKFRPHHIGEEYPDFNTKEIEGNLVSLEGLVLNKFYYFKFEPVCWEFDENNPKLFRSVKVLDSQNYSYFTEDIDKIFDYDNSYIRAWLNDSFIRTAFSNEEEKKLKSIYKSDKVSLLEDNKFKNNSKKLTDYARFMGAYYASAFRSYVGKSNWITRYVVDVRNRSDSVWNIFLEEYNYRGQSVFCYYSQLLKTDNGIVPCVNMTI